MKLHGVLLVVVLIAVLIPVAGYLARSSNPQPAANPETPAAPEPAASAPAPGGAPRVVSMAPANGAQDVPPGICQATVTFDQPMSGGMSFTTRGGQDKYPDITSQPVWSGDMKTITLTMSLQPNRQYVVGVNSPNHKNFKSANGTTLEPVVWQFSTGS